MTKIAEKDKLIADRLKIAIIKLIIDEDLLRDAIKNTKKKEQAK